MGPLYIVVLGTCLTAQIGFYNIKKTQIYQKRTDLLFCPNNKNNDVTVGNNKNENNDTSTMMLMMVIIKQQVSKNT